MGDGVNQPLSEVEELFKTLVWDLLVDAALVALFVAEPWLAYWPFRQIVTGVATLFTNKLFSVGRRTIDMTAIPLINEAHKRAFTDAVVELKVIGYHQGRDSPEYLKARDDAKAALSRFVHFNS